MTNLSIEERFSDQSRRIKMLEEVFVPMAKTAMDIIAGKNGEPGMAENLRNVRDDLEKLVQAYHKEAQETIQIRRDGFSRIQNLETWRKEVEENRQFEREIKLMGFKMSAEVKMGIIAGTFSLVGIVVSKLI